MLCDLQMSSTGINRSKNEYLANIKNSATIHIAWKSKKPLYSHSEIRLYLMAKGVLLLRPKKLSQPSIDAI